jgi:transcriptional regulator with XRE-family HTH domain
VKLDPKRIRQRCTERGISLQALLHEAGVSRTAYYSLARKDSVLPRSIRALAGTLGVRPSALLEEGQPEAWRAEAMLRKARRIVKRNPDAAFEDVWHTLVLLEEDPVERLRRSLLRGRPLDLH